MSAAYDAAQWTDLFVATAGAAAALAGLLFVAVSINVERILSFKGLPERALEALLVLVGALVVAVLCLAPVETDALGWLLLVAGVVLLGTVARLERISLPSRHDRSTKAAFGQVTLALIATAPYVVGAITLLAEAGGGLYWVLAGVIGAIVQLGRQRLGPHDRDPPVTVLGVRLRQRGLMWTRPGGRPMRFIAEQQMDAGRVAFRWRARFGAGLLRPFVVTDAYEDGAGRLEGRLAGVRLFRSTGPDVDRGQVMRYLAELAWLPDPRANPEVRWTDLGQDEAEVAAGCAGGRAAVRLRLGAGGDVLEAYAPDRPRSVDDGSVPTPWRGVFSDHGELGGVRVPRRAEVSWELPEGRFTYWRAEVTALEVVGTAAQR